jgi:hypothetical protein
LGRRFFWIARRDLGWNQFNLVNLEARWLPAAGKRPNSTQNQAFGASRQLILAIANDGINRELSEAIDLLKRSFFIPARRRFSCFG